MRFISRIILPPRSLDPSKSLRKMDFVTCILPSDQTSGESFCSPFGFQLINQTRIWNIILRANARLDSEYQSDATMPLPVQKPPDFTLLGHRMAKSYQLVSTSPPGSNPLSEPRSNCSFPPFGRSRGCIVPFGGMTFRAFRRCLESSRLHGDQYFSGRKMENLPALLCFCRGENGQSYPTYSTQGAAILHEAHEHVMGRLGTMMRRRHVC